MFDSRDRSQFDSLGMTPEDVIKKIMENPDIAMSFQNPKIQAAIMDVSTLGYIL